MTHADGGAVLNRVLRGSPATLAVTFYDDETPTDDGDVTVTVIGSAGATLSTGAATSDDAGNYTYDLPAQADLSHATVKWQGSTRTITSYVDVVGAFYFTLAAGRSSDAALTVEKWDTEALKLGRTTVETEFERISGVSFVPRYGRSVFRLEASHRRHEERTHLDHGLDLLPMPRKLLSVTVDGVGWTSDEMAALTLDPLGYVYGIKSGRNVVIEYEHGFDTPPPDIYRVALVYLRYCLTNQRGIVPDRATQFTATEGGTYQLALPGRAGYDTGLPDVDAVLARYDYKPPGVA